MKELVTDCKNRFADLLGLLPFLVFSLLIQGWTILTLWRWFVVDLFAMPELSIYQAVGLLMFIRSFFSLPRKKEKKEPIYDIRKNLLYGAVFKCVMLLLPSWIVLQFL